MKTQWGQMALPSRERSLTVINRLREGVPPAEDVFLFSIGREDHLRYFERKLDEIAQSHQQGVKFIQADYGHGKTHFLDMLAEVALNRDYVVSIVTLDRDKAPFNKLERVVPLVMDGIMTLSARQGGLSRILRQWAEKVKHLDSNTILRQIDEDEGLQLLFPDFQLKLVEYARFHNRPGGPFFEECLKTERWFRGEETKSKTFKNVEDYLAAFVQFVRHLDYSGFVVMMDEAESITLLSRITNRNQANENLRQIIDNQKLEGFYFLFASTPSFLSGEDDRGAKSYAALWRRISDPLGQIAQTSLDKAIVELPALSVEEFSQLALRVKEIYQIGYDQQMPHVKSEHLTALAGYVKQRTDRSVRTLVRSTVSLLDHARENESLDTLGNYELIVERILQDEERKRAW